MLIKKIARFISLTALFLIPIFPLFVANSMFFPFITGKAFYFRILVEVAFAGWLILAFLDAKYRPRLSPLFVGVTIFAVVTLIADLLGVNPIRSFWSNFERMEGWITIVHLWAFFVTADGLFGLSGTGAAAGSSDSRRLWHRWIGMELAVATIVAIYGLLQLAGKADIHQGSTRIDASLGNAAYMAVYMLWNAGLAVYMSIAARRREIGAPNFFRWAYLVLAVVFGFELFQTATRGTILALLGAVLLSLFLYVVVGRNEPKHRRMTAGAVVVVLLAVMGIFWANRDATFVQKSEVLQRLASISWSEAQGQARNYIWPMALKGVAERPVLGWGQENFNYVFNANYNPKMWNQEQWFDRAHSVFLDWLVASGIVGFAAYVALYVLALMTIWKSAHSVSVKSILTGIFVGYAIHNIFVFDNLASYVLFFATLAFVASYRDARPVGWFGGRTMSAESLSYVGAPVVLVAFLFVIYFFNARPIQANQALIGGLKSCVSSKPVTDSWNRALAVNTYVANQETREQLLSCTDRIILNENMPGQTKQEFFNLARKAIDDQTRATRYEDARIYALAGSFMNIINQFTYALPYLETAHKLSPGKQSIDVELATDYVNQRHPEKALALLAADYQAAPENENVRSTYALALIVTGREQDALALYGGNRAALETQNAAQAYTMAGKFDKAIAIYRKLLAGDPGNINLSIVLARLQYSAGYTSDAVATFRALEKAHPEYAKEIEAAIRQVQ